MNTLLKLIRLPFVVIFLAGALTGYYLIVFIFWDRGDSYTWPELKDLLWPEGKIK